MASPGLRQRRGAAPAEAPSDDEPGHNSELLAVDRAEGEEIVDSCEDNRQLQLRCRFIKSQLTAGGSSMPSSDWAALALLVAARAFSVAACPIADCDEVFNYWDPMHYLLYGDGLQTWEYSPVYALRSYLYVAMHALAGAPLAAMGLSKVTVFYAVRAAIASATASCEIRFVRSVHRAFGDAAAQRCALFLACSTGMFQAAAAFLPSSFAMALGMLAHAYWLDALCLSSQQRSAAVSKRTDASAESERNDDSASRASASHAYSRAIVAVAAAAILGWPYAALLGLPLALESIGSLGFVRFVLKSLGAGAALALPSLLADSFYYGRLTLNVWNQLMYNLNVDDEGGSQLYGIEPWHYYFHNLALNMNLILPAALLLPLLLLCRYALERAVPPTNVECAANATDAADTADTADAATTTATATDAGAARPPRHLGRRLQLCACSGALLWLCFFSLVPHKEERFMYPAYPLLCLSAALSIEHALACADRLLGFTGASRRARRTALRPLAPLALALSAALSGARSLALVRFYGAPLPLYATLHAELSAELAGVTPPPAAAAAARQQVLICVGKEWYRFGSSFFLPSPRARLAFLRDGFNGQLPAHFELPPPAGSRLVHAHFNDRNREEPSRYEALARCDWLVDLELPGETKRHRSRDPAWQVVARRPFLDAGRSKSWARALYIPGLSARYVTFADYVLLRRVKE